MITIAFMRSARISTALTLMIVSLVFAAPEFGYARIPIVDPAASAEKKAPQESEQPAAEESKKPISPVEKEKIEEAGRAVGQRIEAFENEAARLWGKWVEKDLFGDVSWLKLIFSALVLLLVLGVERLVSRVIRRRLQRVSTEDRPPTWWEIFLEALRKPLSFFIWVYGAYFAASILFVHVADPLGESVFRRFAGRLTDIGGALAVVWFVYRVVRLIDVELERRAESPDSQVDDLQASIVGKTIRWVVVIIGAIVLIQNLTGVQAGPLIASLGIGGLAVALAAKESLSNMLGTATILFDKPFKIGERIEIEDYNGIVEQVGYRSTRLRTWDGHVVTLPNQKIITSALENVGIRPHIRWKTNITITYDTPPDKVDRAVEIIRDVIENQEGTDMNTPPWVFFNEFNDASLNIMVWAWYAPPELKAYHAWRMRNCRDIFRRFNEEGIQFAFPTNTTYLANDDTRQLKVELLGARGPDGAPEEAAPLSA